MVTNGKDGLPVYRKTASCCKRTTENFFWSVDTDQVVSERFDIYFLLRVASWTLETIFRPERLVSRKGRLL